LQTPGRLLLDYTALHLRSQKSLWLQP